MLCWYVSMLITSLSRLPVSQYRNPIWRRKTESNKKNKIVIETIYYYSYYYYYYYYYTLWFYFICMFLSLYV